MDGPVYSWENKISRYVLIFWHAVSVQHIDGQVIHILMGIKVVGLWYLPAQQPILNASWGEIIVYWECQTFRYMKQFFIEDSCSLLYIQL